MSGSEAFEPKEEEFKMASPQKNTPVSPLSVTPFGMCADYAIDAFQRSVLFWDVMNRRGNQYRAHAAEKVPHVLDYMAELVIDGRNLERPVNYALARVIPPPEVKINPKLRPFHCRGSPRR